MYIYVSPIVTVVLSVLILKERRTVRSVIGAVLILTGLVISQKRSKGFNMKWWVDRLIGMCYLRPRTEKNKFFGAGCNSLPAV